MTEVKAAAGGDLPGDLNEELLGFVNELKEFRTTVEAKLEKQENRKTMFDRKTAFRGRTPISTTAETELPHQKAFAAYLRSGEETGMRALVPEEKGLSVTNEGGVLVSPQLSDKVQATLHASHSLRQISTVVSVDSSHYEAIVDNSDLSSAWLTEGSAVAESTGEAFVKARVEVHELVAMPKVTQRLLDDVAFDLEGYLAGRIADRFARAEAAAFINGDGRQRPKGLLQQPIVANALTSVTDIGYIPTGAAGDFRSGAPADALVDLVYALPSHYRANAHFLMNSKTAGAVRKLQDADGRFLWADSLAQGQPAQLMGYPVMICEDMPDIAAGAHAIAFGDFREAYTIAERPELRILRDPFSAKPNVLFYASKRVGGAVTNAKAVKLLKFAAS
ncbi:MAG: phage major capsid protein [Tepidimonas taiwanensis]|nr:phage major capsid protein [Tepidimonas taiwanensis]